MDSELLKPEDREHIKQPRDMGNICLSISTPAILSKHSVILSSKDLASVRGQKVNLHSHKICHRNMYVHVVWG